MFKNILFDLDGTLTDSAEGITKSMQAALAAIGIDEPDLNELKKFIGPPLRGSMVKFYNSTPDEVQKALEVYRERYTRVGWAEIKLTPEWWSFVEIYKLQALELVCALQNRSSSPYPLLKNLALSLI